MKRGAGGLWVPDYDTHACVIAGHAQRYIAMSDEHDLCGAVAVDAGAHVGYWSMHMAGDFETVIALEPHPLVMQCLARNIFEAPHANIWPIQTAMSDMQSVGSMREVRPGNSGNWFFKAETPVEAEMSASSLTLDSLFLPGVLDLLKLDVEGMEARALRGAARTIARDKPAVIVELNTAASENFGGDDMEADAILREWGYAHKMGIGRDHLYIHGGQQ